ncbi:hypothetical protein [Bacteroides reticulotermitis]|uniref:hypothetical protein n=1 Tax=Bacteroides reticulotermitis TaxID=1133319 RepID=UPI003A84B322
MRTKDNLLIASSVATLSNKNSASVLIISLLVSILSAYCALSGFLDENLYGSVISTGIFKIPFMAGTISQDIVSIVSSVLMLTLIVLYIKHKDFRIMISIIGLLSFYFYGYGTYVISALYTSVYLIYMLIFTLSILGLILGISGFKGNSVNTLYLPNRIRICGISFLSVIILIFMSKWITDLIPYTLSHTVPDFYAIYILDLCIILPLFIVIIYMLVRNMKLASILLGIALLKTSTLILSVTIGSFIASKYGTQDKASMIIIYCLITMISFVLFLFYCLKIKVKDEI